MIYCNHKKFIRFNKSIVTFHFTILSYGLLLQGVRPPCRSHGPEGPSEQWRYCISILPWAGQSCNLPHLQTFVLLHISLLSASEDTYGCRRGSLQSNVHKFPLPSQSGNSFCPQCYMKKWFIFSKSWVNIYWLDVTAHFNVTKGCMVFVDYAFNGSWYEIYWNNFTIQFIFAFLGI